MTSTRRHGSRVRFRESTISNLLAFCIVSIFAILPTQPAHAQTFTVLHTFQAFEGKYLGGSLMRDGEGNLYGVSTQGGVYDRGTVFKLDASGVLTVLHSFGFDDGGYSETTLIMDKAGNLYGTCVEGGSGNGVIFKLSSKTGQYKLLHTFGGTPDGSFPYGGLVRDSLGNFYGTTRFGGLYNLGAIYKMDKSGAVTIMYNFTGASDGSNPLAGLVLDAAGNLYGTTWFGGDLSCAPSSGCGTVFKLDTYGVLTVLHAFTGGTDGADPQAGLTGDGHGHLYGTTWSGGSIGAGVIFQVDKLGAEKVAYSFGVGGGYEPAAAVIFDSQGNMYGTTVNASFGVGSVFELMPNGTMTFLHIFNQTDGRAPSGGVVRDSAGNLYGATSMGGDLTCDSFGLGCGVIYEISFP